MANLTFYVSIDRFSPDFLLLADKFFPANDFLPPKLFGVYSNALYS